MSYSNTKSKRSLKSRIVVALTLIALIASMFSLTALAGADYSDYTPAEAPVAEEPNVEVPEVEVPDVELPEVETPELDLNEGEEAVAEEEYEYEVYVDIVPLSGFTPAGLTTTHIVDNEAELRRVLGLTTPATRVIRIVNNITLTTAAALPHGGSGSTVHIYSYSAESFAIDRGTSTSRHFAMSGAGTRTIHLHNIRLTRTPGPTRVSCEYGTLGNIMPGGPDNNGGGISLDAAGARLHMHAGSEISHARTAGRGGGIIITNGEAVLNYGARIAHNYATQTGAGGGGGVFIDSGGGRLIVNGATIEYNRSRGTGGGISAAHNQTGTAASLIINDIILRGNEAVAVGGGIHSNTNSTLNMQGLIIIEGNVATNGGGLRFFSSSAATITLTPGSIVRNNIARENGAGLSVRDQNNVVLRIDGVLFEGNRAIGEGGAIRHEATALVADGIRIDNSIFRYNRALNGGAISLVLGNNQNNLPANAETTALRIRSTEFEGNRATAGLLIDENLAARNVNNPFFEGGQVGSVEWVGPYTDVNGNLLGVGDRDHIWNNYDVVTRNRIEGRNIYYNAIGTANVRTTMVAELTQTMHSSNHSALPPGMATVATSTITPPLLLEGGDEGDIVMRNSITNVRLTYVPWNADILGWYNTQITRAWVGNPVTGHMQETVTTTPITAGVSADMRTVTGIDVNQHTRIEVRVNYRYYDVTFTANPSTATTGGTLDGQPSVVRNLRQSRPGGTAVDGAPIGAPPAVVPREGWLFVNWTDGNGNVVTADQIASMFVSGPMTFTANFAPALTLANIPANLNHQNQSATAGGAAVNIPSVSPVDPQAAIVLNAGTVTENHYFLGWYRGPTTPVVGTLVSSLNQNYFTATTDRNNPPAHNATMPNGPLNYRALWGARGEVGAIAARITFHAYGVGNFGRDADNNLITTLEIPVIFGQNIDLRVIEEYLLSEENAFAFWGWFTHEGLATGIPRADLDEYGRRASQSDGVLRRRPAVGTFGFEGGFGPTVTAAGFTRALSFTEAQWNAVADAQSNLELHAIWSLWGDVNDDDRVNSDDLRELTWHVGQLSPRPTLNLAAADVHRNGVVNSDDLRELTWYVGQLFPRPVLGQRPAAPPEATAPADNMAEEDTVIYYIPEYAYEYANDEDYVYEEYEAEEFYVFYAGIAGIMDEVLDGTGVTEALLTNAVAEVTSGLINDAVSESSELTETAEAITEAAASVAGKKLPQTGVEGTMLLWASLMTLALMLALGAVTEIKKRKDSDNA